jgi:hypothetical protein
MGLTMLLHYWESAPNPTEDRKSSKKFACGGQFSILSSKLNGFDHVVVGYYPTPRARSALFFVGASYLYIDRWVKSTKPCCYITGKVLQIRPKIANFQKK